MKKLWEGRFSKESDKRLNDFNSSIAFDSRMYKEDINGSIAHAKTLFEAGVLTEIEKNKIIAALTEMFSDISEGRLDFDPNAEDIHMFIESVLTDRIGNTGKKLHTARSRNDQVATDIRLYTRKEIVEATALLDNLINIIIIKAAENTGTIIPGYTHLQRAQPVTFAHHILAYAQMFLRDKERLTDCNNRLNKCPLGSGALAATTYDINRFFTAESLGFEAPVENSIDGVSDRDFIIEFISALSIVMVHLSRFCEEIILWCSHEFKFIELDDAFSTGSSIMPQKKNPDIAELVRGKSGRVFGSLTTILTVMKALPLSYNKDMQEDKECLFDAVDTVRLCLATFTPMLETMKILPENMRRAAAKGFINATDCADYLVSKGLAFRDAYKICGKIVAYCIENDKTLENLGIEQYKSFSDLFDDDIYNSISLDSCLEKRKVFGGPAAEAVITQINNLREKIKEKS